jgi:hypothetical protein
MKIQFNTDKTISGEERQEEYFSTLIENGLKRFESHISRIEVHLSDQNGIKDGINDIECLLEARMEGKQPIAVSCQAASNELAISGAIDKLKNALETIVGKMKNY